jgi:serine acetyltransferase
MMGPLRRFVGAVRADYASVQHNRAKYHSERIATWKMPLHFVQKIGFQMATAVRFMQLLAELRLTLVAALMSRVIRHLYAAEIHWKAKIAPGISIVHGNGLVIGHGVNVGTGCILFHNVTLGEGLHPDTRESGAPTLEENVHVGPGVTIIGPVTIGAGSKLMAGVVVSRSVPANSLVRPAEPLVSERKRSA